MPHRPIMSHLQFQFESVSINLRKKNFSLLFYLLLLLLVINVSNIHSQKQNNNINIISSNNNLNVKNPQCTVKRMQKMEFAVARIIGFGPNGRPYPDTLPKVKNFCK